MLISTLDVIIMILYGLGMIAVGIYYTGKIESLADYAVAGRRLVPPMALATMAATQIGGGATIGFAGTTYSSGMWLILASVLGAVSAYVLQGSFGARFRESGAMTLADWMERKYGALGGLMGAIATIWLCLAFVGVQYLAVGRVLEGVMGMSVMKGAVIAMIITVIYTTLGGMWSVTATDLIQFMLMLFGFGLLMPISLGKVGGGFSEVLAMVPEAHFQLGPVAALALTYFLIYFFGEFGGAYYLQRFFSTENKKVARFTGIAHPCVSFATMSSAMLLGLLGLAIFPGIESGETILPIMTAKLLPIGLSGLILAALIAVIMSSADSLINTAAASFTNDIYNRFINSTATQSGLIKLGRILTVIFGIGSFLFSIWVPGVFKLMTRIYDFWGPIIFVPVLVGVASGKASPQSGALAAVFGLVGAIFWTIWGGGASIAGWSIPVVVFGTAVSAVTMIVVHLITQGNRPTSGIFAPKQIEG